MKTTRRRQYEWARARVREYKDEYLDQKSGSGGFYLEWERYLQDKLETDVVLKRILAQFAGITIARDVWREDDPVHRRDAGEAPPDDDKVEEPTDTLDTEAEEEADAEADEMAAAAEAAEEEEAEDREPLLPFVFLIDGKKVEPTITFADATVPGGMRKIHRGVCTVGQFILSGELATQNSEKVSTAASIKVSQGRIALTRAGGDRDMLLSDPRVRDPAPDPPPPPRPDDRPPAMITFIYTVYRTDDTTTRGEVEWPENPSLAQIKALVDPLVGGDLEHVNVLDPAKVEADEVSRDDYRDMFIDENSAGGGLGLDAKPRNEAATGIYRANWLRANGGDPEDLPGIYGDAVLFDRRVWF